MRHLDRHLFVCTNQRPDGDPRGCCATKGAEEVREAFKSGLARRGLKGKMRANAAGCLDQCRHGVTVVIYPEQTWYGQVQVGDVDEIIDQHLLGGQQVARLLIRDGD